MTADGLDALFHATRYLVWTITSSFVLTCACFAGVSLLFALHPVIAMCVVLFVRVAHTP